MMDQFCDKSIFESYMTQIYEKSFQDVFLNFFSLLLTIVFSFSVWGVFMILQPFLKPLIWALLFGSVLHPFKHMLTKKFIKWIDTMENTPVQLYLLQLVTTPLKLTLDFSIYFGDLIMKYAIALISIILGILMVGLIYNYTPNFIYYLFYIILHNSITLFDTLLNICEKTSMVTAVVVVYVFSLQYLWSPQLNSTFYYLPSFVWLTLTGYISGYFGFFRLAMFMFFQLLYILGIIYNWWNSKKIEQHIVSNDTTNYTEDINNQKLLNLSSDTCKDENESKELKRNANMTNTFLVEWPLNHLWQFASDNTSDIYIYWVAMACVTTIVLKSSWLLYIIVLLLSIYATKHLSAYFGITVFFHKQYNSVLGYFKNWFITRKEAIFISPIKGIVTVCYVIKMQILELLKGSSDSAATVMVILGLLIFLIFSTAFLGIQACTEGVYMIKVGGNVINQTVVHNPGLKQLLPDNWEHKVDLALNNAYMYGREWLYTMVHNMLVDVHEEKAIELEKRALDLWDRVYQAWIMNALEEKTIGPKVTSKAVYQTWYHFLDGFQKTPELMNMKTLSQLLQNNTETLKGGLESLWDIAKGNASILLHAISTMLSVLFNHGFAVFNFFISMVIFLTALFYLLNSSRQLYKPVEMACTISPVYGERLGLAFEKAINEVLIASFKLAIFYGMWTWLIHNIFQMNIVYIPTVLATILAVVPVLGTYWACLPGVIDLWLVQGKNIHAIVLACFQFLPTTIVDATIYNEINSGHPYLTGLSVAGGLFCLGIEGAIIGPLVLCGLHVVINLSTVFLQDSKTTQ